VEEGFDSEKDTWEMWKNFWSTHVMEVLGAAELDREESVGVLSCELSLVSSVKELVRATASYLRTTDPFARLLVETALLLFLS
jgi:hypothetical protein